MMLSSEMPDFINPNSYAVHLTGPDGQIVRIGGGGRKSLSDYFDRYCGKGYLRRIENSNGVSVLKAAHTQNTQVRRANSRQMKKQAKSNTLAPAKTVRYTIGTKQRIRANQKQILSRQPRVKPSKRIVGRAIHGDATQQLISNLKARPYPISNNIGVGILSYNRPHSLCRLLESIAKFTDLNRTTIFVSDDGSIDPEVREILTRIETTNSMVVLLNPTRIGVAGNTNRLLRCLSRFRFGLILNDDLEILNHGWDNFYPEAMVKSGFHHFCLHQSGIYGARDGIRMVHNGVDLTVVRERPHGAVLAFTHELFNRIGYLDEQFGLYGMEHVDWSSRAQYVDLQPSGFYDVANSSKYFKLYPEPSAVENRQVLLNESRHVLTTKDPKRGFVQPTDRSVVPVISYVIPCRNLERHGAIETVTNNVRAQRYPQIQMIMIEHDIKACLVDRVYPIQHRLVQSNGAPFNKSRAFNTGITLVGTEKVILHDADIIVGGDYTGIIAKVLDEFDACHLGKTVLYVTKESTERIIESGMIDGAVDCDRIVGYFEGGSLACRRRLYWSVGGFNEDFEGWGVEDCEFFQRLSNNCNWSEDRRLDFIHLWHGRAPGWENNHVPNKNLERRLSGQPMATRIRDQHDQLRRNGYSLQLE